MCGYDNEFHRKLSDCLDFTVGSSVFERRAVRQAARSKASGDLIFDWVFLRVF